MLSSENDAPVLFGPGKKLFGVLHGPPPGVSSVAGWVICPPFGQERTNAHRFMFELATAISELGFWTLRFDYRGTGESVGKFEDADLDDYLEDIDAAIRELEIRAGAMCRGLLGVRLGASLAVLAAAKSGRKLDLALIEPIVDGETFRDELLRTAMANEMLSAGGARRVREELREDIFRGADVAVDGFVLGRKMYESLGQLNLDDVSWSAGGRVLVIQADSRPGRPRKRDIAALADRGAEFRQVVSPPAWFRIKEYQWRPPELFAAIGEWIPPSGLAGTGLSLNAAEIAAEEFRYVDGLSLERPVGFQVEGRDVRGMLHLPRNALDGRPAVLMLSAGESCRSGVFYVRMARELARAGWPVLRFDPRGIGDSRGDMNVFTLAEVFVKIQNAGLLADTVAAIDFLEREMGDGRVILTGLCGGAITSIFAAAEDERVVGIAPLELRMHFAALPREKTAGISWAQTLANSQKTMFLLNARKALHAVRAGTKRMMLRARRAFRPESIAGGDRWLVERLGADVNLPMIRSLRQALERRMPVHCIFAETEEPKHFQVIQQALGTVPSLSFETIKGADHNFVNPGFSDALIGRLMQWLESSLRPWNMEGLNEGPLMLDDSA